MGELTAEQTALDSKYAGLLNDMNKYIKEQVLAYGENEYAKYLENLKYEEQLKQIAWEQAFKEKQLAEQIRQFNAELSFKRAQAASANPYGGYGGLIDNSGGDPKTETVNSTKNTKASTPTPKGKVLVPSKAYNTVLTKVKNMKPTKDNRQSNANYQKQLNKWKDNVASYVNQQFKAGKIKDFEVKSILSELGLR